MADKYIKKLADVLCGLIFDKRERDPEAYDTTATVRRIEDGKAYVHIPGGVDETPVDLTIDAAAGDTVQVRVSGGRAWLVGNRTAPPTDDTEAIVARTVAKLADQNATAADNKASEALDDASRAKAAADSAEASATSAQASAENASEYASRALGNLSTVQSVAETLTWITQHGTMTLTSDQHLDPTHVYFVVDAGGDYVVGGTHYSIVTEPDEDDLSTYYELSINESLNNYVGTHLALDGEGLWLLPATSGTNKVLIATGAGSTYTTAGTYIVGASGVLASFTSTKATIGQNVSGMSRVAITENGMQIYRKTSSGDITVANLGYGAAAMGIEAPFYVFGLPQTGLYGHYSVTEGYLTNATSEASHAEGHSSKANGKYSHAQNSHTIASKDSQTVIGKYNIEDTATTEADQKALIIGNGTSSARSNALTVDWRGNVIASGDITDGTGNVLSDKADMTDIPTATSDLTNDSGFIASDSNGNVTISGKATLGAINGDQLFAYTSVSVTTSSISANASGEVTSSASNLAGYYPLAIAEVNISTGVASLRRFYFSTQETGKAVVKIGVQNDGTSAKTISATARILWVKVTA